MGLDSGRALIDSHVLYGRHAYICVKSHRGRGSLFVKPYWNLIIHSVNCLDDRFLSLHLFQENLLSRRPLHRKWICQDFLQFRSPLCCLSKQQQQTVLAWPILCVLKPNTLETKDSRCFGREQSNGGQQKCISLSFFSLLHSTISSQRLCGAALLFCHLDSCLALSNSLWISFDGQNSLFEGE